MMIIVAIVSLPAVYYGNRSLRPKYNMISIDNDYIIIMIILY